MNTQMSCLWRHERLADLAHDHPREDKHQVKHRPRKNDTIKTERQVYISHTVATLVCLPSRHLDCNCQKQARESPCLLTVPYSQPHAANMQFKYLPGLILSATAAVANFTPDLAPVGPIVSLAINESVAC